MQIFKAYFKVLNRHKMSMLIYFIIFIITSMLVMSAIKGQSNAVFSETKNNIVIFNNDGETPLIGGLRSYLSENANIITIKDDSEAVQDALFYGNVDYVLRIPAGFTQSFLDGTDGKMLQKTTTASGAVGMNMDLLINKYLNITSLYEKSLPGLSQDELAGHVLSNLSVTSGVDFNSSKQASDTSNLSYYFRINAYSIAAILMMGVMMIMLTFNEPDLFRRNLCSPMSPMKMNLQMFFGNAAFAVGIWAALIVVNFILYGTVDMGTGVLLLCLNALVFSVTSLSIGFVAGKFIKSYIVMSAVTNVVSLGMCFLSGVFVDQELLGSSVQTIASFTPAYWYMKAVNTIRDMSVYSAHNMKPILIDILIQLAFAAACIIVALVASKQKKQNMAR